MSDASKIMTCEHVIDVLDDYRRGTLTPDQRRQVLSHLQRCESCTAELSSRESLAQQILSSVPVAVSPRSLSGPVQAAIQQVKPVQEQGKGRRGSMLPWMLAAAVVIVSGVALVQMRPDADLRNSEIATNSIQTLPAEETYFARDAMESAKPSSKLLKEEGAGQSEAAIAAPEGKAATVVPDQVLSLATPQDTVRFIRPQIANAPEFDAPTARRSALIQEDAVQSRKTSDAPPASAAVPASTAIPSLAAAPAHLETRQRTLVESAPASPAWQNNYTLHSESEPAAADLSAPVPRAGQPQLSTFADSVSRTADKDYAATGRAPAELAKKAPVPMQPRSESLSAVRSQALATTATTTTGTLTTETLTTAARAAQSTATLETTAPR